MHTFPANESIYLALWLQALPERFSAGAQGVFVPLLLLSVYGVSRAVGARVLHAQLSTLGVLSIPMVAFSITQAGADIGGLAMLGMAVYFAVAQPWAPRVDALLAGLACGLAYGFKSLHLVSSVSVAAAFLAVYFGTQSREQISGRLREATIVMLLFLLAAASTAGFWMIRNYLLLGNPLYPVHFSGFDLLGWASALDIDYSNRLSTQLEWVRGSWEWPLYPWIEWHFIEQNFKHSSGTGAWFAAFVPVGILLALFLPSSRFTQGGRRFILAIASIAVLAVWWFLGDRQPRYALGLLVFAIPLSASLMTSTKGWPRRSLELLAAANAAIMIGLVCATLGLDYADRVVYSQRFERNEWYGYPEVLDDLPLGSIVANLSESRSRHWALTGKRHTNRVVSSLVARKAIGPVPNLAQDGRQTLDGLLLRELGVTHVYWDGAIDPIVRRCGRFRLVGEDAFNRVSGKPYSMPRRVYAFDVSDECNS